MTEKSGKATARAHANIALIKYWGKRDQALMLPATPSISLTLDKLYTETTVSFAETLPCDTLVLDKRACTGPELAKVSAFLDGVRALGNTDARALVRSTNFVPTAAGLASSASGFAALAAASARALGLELDDRALSRLARRGSGSACRSIFGGFVEWQMGEREDGLDSFGVPLAPGGHWDLRMVVTVLTPAAKEVSSREGMRRTVETSPFYPAWVQGAAEAAAAARRAIAERDFKALGSLAEANALRMHATMLGAMPPFTYWLPESLALMRAVQELRAAGVDAYFTMDAGPNLKVLCQPADEPQVLEALAAVPGVKQLIACAPGPGITYLNAETGAWSEA